MFADTSWLHGSERKWSEANPQFPPVFSLHPPYIITQCSRLLMPAFLTPILSGSLSSLADSLGVEDKQRAVARQQWKLTFSSRGSWIIKFLMSYELNKNSICKYFLGRCLGTRPVAKETAPLLSEERQVNGLVQKHSGNSPRCTENELNVCHPHDSIINNNS